MRLQISIVATAALVALTKAQNPSWSCDREYGYDFPGTDLGNVQSPIELCCNACADTPQCSVWTWTSFNNGTCWLKQGNGGDPAVVPGAVTSSMNNYDSTACFVYRDVSFEGNDLTHVPATKFQDCCQICRNYAGCRAYSWSPYEGGACWLKSKLGTAKVEPGTVSANAYGGVGSLFVVDAGVDYSGSDIGQEPAADLATCIQSCQDTYRCMAVTWGTYNGGTCWLKYWKSTTSASSTVTSAWEVEPVNPAVIGSGF